MPERLPDVASVGADGVSTRRDEVVVILRAGLDRALLINEAVGTESGRGVRAGITVHYLD